MNRRRGRARWAWILSRFGVGPYVIRGRRWNDWTGTMTAEEKRLDSFAGYPLRDGESTGDRLVRLGSVDPVTGYSTIHADIWRDFPDWRTIPRRNLWTNPE